MVSSIVSLIRFVSTVICLIVIVSFGSFAIDQAKSASTRQQEQLWVATPTSPASTTGTAGTAGTAGAAGTAATVHRESAVHKTLEDASRRLTSPFSGVVSESSSEWAIRGAKLLLALLVYGFGLGYLAQMLRVRV